MLLTAEASFERFGTCAFGIEIIRGCISFDDHGRCLCSAWWRAMPMRYWEDVTELLIPVIAKFNHRRHSPETIEAIHREICQVIEKGLLKKCPNLRRTATG